MDGIVTTRTFLIPAIPGSDAAGIPTIVLMQACSTSADTMAMPTVSTLPALPCCGSSSDNFHEREFV